MNQVIGAFLRWANENGWDVAQKTDVQLHLDSGMTSRYKEIPNDYIEFLSVVKHCIAPNETAWFLCEDAFNNRADHAFQWNEFELLSLEAAMNDARWKAEIKAWWDRYLPIVMSVGDGYSFYAIDLVNEKGAIVRGYEPEFEEVETAANSLEHFLELIMSRVIQFP